jgi:hypothetical protein
MRAIVFSKDRPLQLAATLASFKATLHADDWGRAEVVVLYLATDEQMYERYHILRQEFGWAAFVPQHEPHEGGFHRTFATLCQGTKHLCFVVDDTLFVRPWSSGEAIEAMDSHPAAAPLGISLRLGQNCTHSYVKGDVPQNVPHMYRADNGWFVYHWPSAEMDFDYPLEVSSSIYRTEDIYPLINHGGYRNPNELEMVLAAARGGFKETRPMLLCPEKSIAFSNPLNVVQTTCFSRAQYGYGYKVDTLGRLFDAGFRVNLKDVMGYTPRAVHEEFAFNMRIP